jgi:hypothetical protein
MRQRAPRSPRGRPHWPTGLADRVDRPVAPRKNSAAAAPPSNPCQFARRSIVTLAFKAKLLWNDGKADRLVTAHRAATDAARWRSRGEIWVL